MLATNPEVSAWLTWGFQGVLGFLLVKLWTKSEEALKAINDLRVELAKDYATNTEVTMLRSRIHDITSWMMQEKAIRELLKEQSKADCRAELK